MVINKRIKRVLLENKVQYIGSILLIIFSCFMFTLMSQFAMNFERLANEYKIGYVQEDASFTTSKAIDNLQEVEQASNAIIEEGNSFDYKISEDKSLRIFSQNEKINIPSIIDGKGLSQSGDIIITPTFADANKYKIGDEITIFDKTFTISGFMTLPNYIYPLQSEMDMMPQPSFGIAVISKDDYNNFGKGSSFYSVKFNNSSSPHENSIEFKEMLRSRDVEIVKWTDIEDNKRVNIVNAEIKILNIVSKAIPTAILFLVIILISNVLRRMIKRESAIIGALYSLGYRRKEIKMHYIMFPLILSLIGGITGTILGTFPVRSMAMFMFNAFIIPLTGIKFSPILFIVSIFLPVLFLGFSSYFVLNKELKRSPVDLMRGNKDNNKANFLENTIKLEKLKFNTKFKIREQLRSLSRLLFLLVGIIIATMLLLWGFALKSGFDYMVTNGLSSVYNFEYEYKFDNLRYDKLPQGAEPGTSTLFLPTDDEKKDFYVCGVKPDSELISLVDETGAPLSTNQVIITKPLANQLNLKQGDTANIIRKLDGRMFSVKVDVIADTYAGKFMFMPLNDYNKTFEMPKGSYNGVFSNVKLDISENEPYSVITLEEKVAGVKEAIAPTQSMIGVLATVAFIIGMIVIYVVTSLIVEENKNIISLMKIFGYKKKEINSLILNSSTFVVVFGYIIGIPLIVQALGVLTKSLENSVGMSLPPMRIDLLYIIIGFIVVMFSYELSKFMCKKKVNLISMSDALKSGMD